jgi:hypothetical protein
MVRIDRPNEDVMQPTFASFNRAFALALALSIGVSLAVDHWLFARRGFLALFGYGTQEGQIVNKLDHAPGAAKVADIIFFGSSLTRSGMAPEPFLEKGLVPLNLAVTGGGPLFSYYALKRIESQLRQRVTKPTLVLELNTFHLLAPKGWDEYPHFISAVRSRWETLRDFPALWSHFAQYRMQDRVLGRLFLPSLYYQRFGELALAQGTFGRTFYGEEDASGFFAINTVSDTDPTFDPVVRPPTAYNSGKVQYLRRFVELAGDIGAPVVLYAYPWSFWTTSHAAPLTDYLRRFGGVVSVIGNSEIKIGRADVQSCCGAHLNSRGSKRVAGVFADKLPLHGDIASLKARWSGVVRELPLPFEEVQLDGTASANDVVAAGRVPVQPGRPVVLDVDVDVEDGQFALAVEPVIGGVVRFNGTHPFPLGLEPLYLRQGPMSAGIEEADEVQIRLIAAQAAARGVVRLKRLWQRPGN